MDPLSDTLKQITAALDGLGIRYADGGEVSDRQWNDIVGLVVTNPDMDAEYVNLWASRLGVSALLERARADALKE